MQHSFEGQGPCYVCNIRSTAVSRYCGASLTLTALGHVTHSHDAVSCPVIARCRVLSCSHEAGPCLSRAGGGDVFERSFALTKQSHVSHSHKAESCPSLSQSRVMSLTLTKLGHVPHSHAAVCCPRAAALLIYRGTSLTRKRTPLGPYRRPMPRVLEGSWGGRAHARGVSQISISL